MITINCRSRLDEELLAAELRRRRAVVLLELYPLTVVGLRSWPNPKGRGKAHSGIDQVTVRGPHDKVKLKAGKRKKPLFSR